MFRGSDMFWLVRVKIALKQLKATLMGQAMQQ